MDGNYLQIICLPARVTGDAGLLKLQLEKVFSIHASERIFSFHPILAL